MSSGRDNAYRSALPSTSQAFQYDPLTDPESEIRLLRILPQLVLAQPVLVRYPRRRSAPGALPSSLYDIASLTDSNYMERDLINVGTRLPAVRCEIFHAKLHEAPPFKALSYTWGSPNDPQHSIIMNGRTISVRENLFLALQQFHTRPETLIIWIDAVCINQADENERNEQVAKMKTIYEHAEEVCVWLGPSYKDSHLAFKVMQDMYDHRDDVEWIVRLFSQPDVKKAVLALTHLVSNHYWWRMWIVQELVSARSISLHCGVEAIAAAALNETQSLFRAMGYKDHGFRNDHLFDLMPTDSELRARLQYQGMYDVRIFQNAFDAQNLSFFQTLLYNWHRETTEAEDMVYGLAALANSRSEYKISIDYSRSVTEIYVDLAKKELQHCTTLEIPRERDRVLVFQAFRLGCQIGRAVVNITSCMLSENLISDVGDVLVLKGVVIGKVEAVGERPAMTHWTDLEGAGRTFLSWWALLGTTGGRGERRQEQFGKTLICDRLMDRNHEGWRREEVCRSIVGRFVDFFNEELPAEEIGSELVSARSWMVQRTKEIDEQLGYRFAEEYMKDFNRTWVQSSAYSFWNRRFFLGPSNIMGLAPEGVEEGDIICVPLGCPHPMIFRKVEDHYIVIGEAYVDGYMRGKAIEMLENGELELETFELH
ncbi:hypothetical protein IFR04_010920 [Cadophora malorum]|uniref:Heterokaryon incompatibility domain-containing protein n=1 Tax=Cadophora malorum TaxID=108018 RepID=A0A8H7TBD7_9HELO|nr:hypothetical protein IFR04_010920 [Cadophora malorum]